MQFERVQKKCQQNSEKKYKIYHDTSKQRVSICSTSQLIEHITKKKLQYVVVSIKFIVSGTRQTQGNM